MKLEEFQKLDRGPYLFDTFVHPNRISSVLGDFTVELTVDDESHPTQRMVEAAHLLATRLEKDQANLAQLVFKGYVSACSDPEWMSECGVELGLTLQEIGSHIAPRTISVAYDDDPGAVYLEPDWERDHSLCFLYDSGTWIRA